MATLVVRTADGHRFVAMSDPADPALATRMMGEEPLGAHVRAAVNAQGRTILSDFTPTGQGAA